jgi:hypothetical protein
MHDPPSEVLRDYVLSFFDVDDTDNAIWLIGSNDILVQRIAEELVNNFNKNEPNIQKVLRQIGISVQLYTIENNKKILDWDHLDTEYVDIVTKPLAKLSRWIKNSCHDIEQSIQILQPNLVMKSIKL